MIVTTPFWGTSDITDDSDETYEWLQLAGTLQINTPSADRTHPIIIESTSSRICQRLSFAKHTTVRDTSHSVLRTLALARIHRCSQSPMAFPKFLMWLIHVHIHWVLRIQKLINFHYRAGSVLSPFWAFSLSVLFSQSILLTIAHSLISATARSYTFLSSSKRTNRSFPSRHFRNL